MYASSESSSDAQTRLAVAISAELLCTDVFVGFVVRRQAKTCKKSILTTGHELPNAPVPQSLRPRFDLAVAMIAEVAINISRREVTPRSQALWDWGLSPILYQNEFYYKVVLHTL